MNDQYSDRVRAVTLTFSLVVPSEPGGPGSWIVRVQRPSQGHSPTQSLYPHHIQTRLGAMDGVCSSPEHVYDSYGLALQTVVARRPGRKATHS